MANSQIIATPSKTKVNVGELYDLIVSVNPGVTIAGVQCGLVYNPDAVQINSVVQGAFLGSNSFFMPGTTDNVAGKVTGIVGATLGAGSGVTTNGVFCTLKCQAKTASKVSNFVFVDTMAGSPAGAALPLDLSITSQVTVLSPLDLSGDGIINVADLALLMVAFGLTGAPGWRKEDVNKDGGVNVLDMILIAQAIVP